MGLRVARLCLAAFAAATLVALLGTTPAWAAPRALGDDAEVLEQLPARLPGAAPRRAAAQRAGLRSQPANLPLALALARESIDQARLSGDPRDWGQAQAALAAWWTAPAPPPAVRLLRATVRQGQHAFAESLTDLGALAAMATAPLPLRAQAELTRAAVWQVQGRWDDARSACERLASPGFAPLGSAVALPAQACLAELDQLQGRVPAVQAASRLAALAREAERRGEDTRWLHLLHAELAQRQGRPEAGSLFALASAGEQPGIYALASHADWLLENSRAADAERLLAGRDGADALLLRLAIARQRGGRAETATDIAQLRARFDAAALRNESGHEREQARYALDLLGDTPAALALAQANWARQREPADALLLWRAAQAARQPAVAEGLRQWAREQGFTDARWAAPAHTKGAPP
jgi:hypothetical protein